MPDYNSNEFNMVLEIQKGTKAKLEMSSQIAFNPIIQEKYAEDQINSKDHRSYAQDIIGNYGSFP